MSQALAPKPYPEFVLALGDCAVLVRRSMRHLTRNIDQIFQTVLLPIVLLLLFRYLFGGAVQTGGPSYVNYVIAGVLVLSVTFSASATAVGVTNDLQEGIVERFRTMPMFSSAMLVGHVVSAVLRNGVSTALVIGVGWLVGFRPSAGPGEWLAALGILLLFTTAISWLATLLGILARSVEGANGLAMIVVFLPYASSALVPSETMPSVLRAFVEHQPVTPVVDAVRGLLVGTPHGDSAWSALAWWVPALVLTAALTIRHFRRRTNA
ncbi:ABC transporter permease [Streptomyces oceani]|uniref:Transport permease protein n=1 Tax=Streptomyces oceani TaxID=1075402 RepID=A0A1E7KNY1_9ACTN|nr:ABC transporter permease [Streptomyces oceani]OEV05596.1 multidrug ABC transporter permease [Streptomyces oceani]